MRCIAAPAHDGVRMSQFVNSITSALFVLFSANSALLKKVKSLEQKL